MKVIMNLSEINRHAEHAAELVVRKHAHNKGKDLVICGVAVGARRFTRLVVRKLRKKLTLLKVIFVRVKSYDGDKRGELTLMKGIEINLKNCEVVIIEDIIDSGKTIRFLIDHITELGARTVKVFALLNKVRARVKSTKIKLAFYGKIVAKKHFLVGFGLDYKSHYRNWDVIVAVEPGDDPKDRLYMEAMYQKLAA